MAKEKSPSFQFYPKEYQTDENVQSMSPAERGVYVDLLCTCWQEGSIPTDPRRLARMGRVSVEDMEAMWEFIGPCFHPDPENPDRLLHGRLDKEREKQRAWREQRSEAGRASGKARRRKSKSANKNEHPLNERSPTVEQQGRQETGDRKVESSKEEQPEKPDPVDVLWSEVKTRYPKRSGSTGWAEAKRRMGARIREGADPEVILDAVQRYWKWCEVTGKLGKETVMKASTFFGRGFEENVENPWTAPKDGPRKDYNPTAAVAAKEAEARRAAETTKREAETNEDVSRVQQWIASHKAEHQMLRNKLAMERDIDLEDTAGRAMLLAAVTTEIQRILEAA